MEDQIDYRGEAILSKLSGPANALMGYLVSACILFQLIVKTHCIEILPGFCLGIDFDKNTGCPSSFETFECCIATGKNETSFKIDFSKLTLDK